jgi:phosphoglycerate kinase
MKKIQDVEIKDKKVLLRVDFNVPMKGREIEGDKRMREAIPTIQYLLDQQVAHITICSHLGKPDGKFDEKFSLWPVANRLAKLLGLEEKFTKTEDEFKISDKITLLENLRFDEGEEKNAPRFNEYLASKGSIYINDAFGTCHRAHASTAGVAALLPAYAGLLVQKEVAGLQKLLQSQEKPFTVIFGGAKIADKLPVIKNFATRADNFLIGGAIASTFLAARRHYLGKSLIEKDDFQEANITYQTLTDEPGKNLYLPKDLVLSLSAEKAEDVRTVNVQELLEPNYEDYMAVDIGSETIELCTRVIKDSKTIFWNGDMGVSEVKEFSNGTIEIAKAIAESSAYSVIGGGDTVAAVENIEPNKPNIFLSTGGGATLEYLAGKVLPGLKVLE